MSELGFLPNYPRLGVSSFHVKVGDDAWSKSLLVDAWSKGLLVGSVSAVSQHHQQCGCVFLPEREDRPAAPANGPQVSRAGLPTRTQGFQHANKVRVQGFQHAPRTFLPGREHRLIAAPAYCSTGLLQHRLLQHTAFADKRAGGSCLGGSTGWARGAGDEGRLPRKGWTK